MFVQQTIRFMTDFVGLERILRFVHAFLIITISSPVIVGLIAAVVGPQPTPGPNAGTAVDAIIFTETVLRGVLARIGLTRALFRTFRFLDDFSEAHKIVMRQLDPETAKDDDETRKTPVQRLIPWLDATARACNGIYLATDIVLLADALDVPGLTIWDVPFHDGLRRVSQQHWFWALAASLVGNVLRIRFVTHDLPPPGTAGFGSSASVGSTESPLPNDSGGCAALEQERHRLRALVQRRTAQRRAWQRAVRERLSVVGRRVLTDACDLFLPGSFLQWLPVPRRTVGILMLGSTALTAWEAWNRCGHEVAERVAADAAAAAARREKRARRAEKHATAKDTAEGQKTRNRKAEL